MACQSAVPSESKISYQLKSRAGHAGHYLLTHIVSYEKYYFCTVSCHPAQFGHRVQNGLSISGIKRWLGDNNIEDIIFEWQLPGISDGASVTGDLREPGPEHRIHIYCEEPQISPSALNQNPAYPREGVQYEFVATKLRYIHHESGVGR